MGMASTFLVRLRVGEILMDAKGVSQLYRAGIRAREALLLVGSALLAVVVTILVSESLRAYLAQMFHTFLEWVGRII